MPLNSLGIPKGTAANLKDFGLCHTQDLLLDAGTETAVARPSWMDTFYRSSYVILAPSAEDARKPKTWFRLTASHIHKRASTAEPSCSYEFRKNGLEHTSDHTLNSHS